MHASLRSFKSPALRMRHAIITGAASLSCWCALNKALRSLGQQLPSMVVAALLQVLLALSTCAANMVINEPDPLAGTGYPAENSNYLCLRRFGKEVAGDTYT